MSQEKCCIEPPELIELCKRCTRPDCNNDDGCEEYRALKQQVAPQRRRGRPSAAKEASAPMPAIELVQPFDSAAKTLMRCNDAIAALEALHNDEGCFMIFDSGKIEETLVALKEARIREYGALIDWNAIAERMKENG